MLTLNLTDSQVLGIASTIIAGAFGYCFKKYSEMVKRLKEKEESEITTELKTLSVSLNQQSKDIKEQSLTLKGMEKDVDSIKKNQENYHSDLEVLKKEYSDLRAEVSGIKAHIEISK